MRDSFVFYRSFFEAIKIQPKEIQTDIYSAIFDYIFNDKQPDGLNPMVQSLFILIKPQLDANNQRYENGKKGGRPKKENQTITNGFENKKPMVIKSENQTITETKPNVNVNVNVNENVNDNVNVIGGEPEHCSDSSSTEPAVIQIVLNDKSFFNISQKQVDEWKELFPAVDIIQELRKMKAWCDANPDRRKTKRGINRFIVSWLSKEQDRGKTANNSTPTPLKTNNFTNYNQRKYDYNDIERAEIARLRKEVNAD